MISIAPRHARPVLLLLALAVLSPARHVCAQQRPGIVRGPLVTSERWPECTNLSTWVRDIMRLEGVEHASETAQAKVLFRWLRLFNRMATGGMIQAFEGEYGKEEYVTDAHKNLFVYGWGYCDTTSRIAEAVWTEHKKDRSAGERVCVQHADGGFHTMYRLRMDGRYGAFDPRYGYYLIETDAPDSRILDWAQVGVDENILDNRTFRNRSGPFFEYFGVEWERALLLEPRYFASESEWVKAGSPVESVFGDPKYEMGTRFHDMDFELPKGTTIERHWDNTARRFYVPAGAHTKREEPFRPSGRFYRVTETMLEGNWPKHDPNYKWARPYLTTVPGDEGYNTGVAGGRTLGQAWGRTVYAPDLGAGAPETIEPGSGLVHAATAPHLRAPGAAAASAVFDIRSPYVLVDGTLSGKLSGGGNDGLAVEIRTLRPKPLDDSEPDRWSQWETVHRGPGRFSVALGRERFRADGVSIHGVYRFQIRVSTGAAPSRTEPAGLCALRLETFFENGIMSIPQIFEGKNTVRFKVEDPSKLRGPVRVIYRYQTAQGEKTHEQTLRRADFHGNAAAYEIDAPGLVRCNSVSVSY